MEERSRRADSRYLLSAFDSGRASGSCRLGRIPLLCVRRFFLLSPHRLSTSLLCRIELAKHETDFGHSFPNGRRASLRSRHPTLQFLPFVHEYLRDDEVFRNRLEVLLRIRNGTREKFLKRQSRPAQFPIKLNRSLFRGESANKRSDRAHFARRDSKIAEMCPNIHIEKIQ